MEMLNCSNGLLRYAMGKPSKPPSRKLFVAEWTIALKRPIDDLPISRSYASNLKAGRKFNLGSEKLFEIAGFLEIRIEDL